LGVQKDGPRRKKIVMCEENKNFGNEKFFVNKRIPTKFERLNSKLSNNNNFRNEALKFQRPFF